MKNLNITEGRRVDFGAQIVGHCMDSDNRTLYVLASDYSLLYTKSGDIQVARLDFRLDRTKLISPTLSQSDVILVEYIVENRGIVIALQNGQILQVSLLYNEPNCNILHQHPTNLCSVKYSPNQDLVALADQTNQLTIFTSSFEQIESTDALIENNSAHKPVGVGWGSKETQFFGLDGRPSKEKETKDQVSLSLAELEDIKVIEASDSFKEFRQVFQKNTVIDWRGDGHFLATLTYIPEDGKHYLKVWNRNLELQYMSERLVTVERGLISWVPNGQYVCLAQQRNSRVNEIALFEKNGMVHQRITLPLSSRNLYIQAMSWSADSQILVLLVKSFEVREGQVDCKHIVFFYTMQNFHYYLKSSFFLNNTVLQPRWDPTDSRLYLIDTVGHYTPLDCKPSVNHVREYSTVYVVDANRILVTPLDLCNVPPPMSAFEIVLPELIHRIAVCPRNNKALFVVTPEAKLFSNITRAGHNDLPETSSVKNTLFVRTSSEVAVRYENIQRVNISDINDLHHLKCIKIDDAYLLLAIQQTKGSSRLLLIDPIACHKTELIDLGDRLVLGTAQNLSRDDDSQLAIVYDDGFVEFVDPKTKTILERKSIFTADIGKTISGFINTIIIQLEDAHHLITLSSDSTLRCDDRVISLSCNSFRTTEHYLLYTTNDNNIHLIVLDRLKDVINNVCDTETWSQGIENGGTLVSASEQSSKVVLQMPRGNLETLHLRIFVLTSLTNLLSAGHYVEAIKLARRHRLNQNFLCDYLLRFADAPFLITKFAALIAEDDPTLLNLFISELDDTDTILGRYQNIMRHLPKSSAIPKLETSSGDHEKVNQICSYIILPEEPKYLQPRLLCLLKHKPSRTTEALKIIHELKKDLRESCLRFVLYFVDVEQLFLDAIKTYDTDIALMVAGASNKDPKEYLALLDSFNSTTDSSLRRYQMDLHVGNYESAFDNLLEYLSHAEDKTKVEADVVWLVSSKRIFKHATSILNKQINFESLTQTIWLKYADYLLEKKYYLEAGVAYGKALALSENVEHLSSALKCFSLADYYDISLALIARSNANKELKNEHCSKIAKQLFERGKNLAAIAIMQDIPEKMLDERVSNMVSNGEWYLAEYFSSEEIRPSIRGSNLLAILEHCDTKLQSIAEIYRASNTHFARLLELIEDYDEMRFSNQDPDNLADSLSTVDGSDASSLAPSATNPQKGAPRSGAPSLKTRVSSKSNRFQVANKKRISLRQGSRHEDLALVLELQKFVARLTKWQENNIRISAALFTYCDLNIARDRNEAMSRTMSGCYDLAKKIIDTLWPSTIQQDDKYSLYRRFGTNVIFSPDNQLDNTDLQVLMRPQLPECTTGFEL